MPPSCQDSDRTRRPAPRMHRHFRARPTSLCNVTHAYPHVATLLGQVRA
jgi:hypothetical protein